ncbi:MAG TPA: hypothetical protein VGE12_10790 [Noviherbaspirillum sp.]
MASKKGAQGADVMSGGATHALPKDEAGTWYNRLLSEILSTRIGDRPRPTGA